MTNRSEAGPSHKLDLIERFDRSQDRVLEAWIRAARSEIPSAALVSREELLNGLPELLRQLSRFFAVEPGSEGELAVIADLIVACREHGANRADLNIYTLDEVIEEYRLLRRGILESLRSDGSLHDVDLLRLLEVIDHGIVEAVAEFTAKLGFPASKLRGQMDVDLSAAREELQASRDEAGTLREERGARERWVYTLSHDLRGPLSAAAAAARLISIKSGEADYVRKMADRIVTQIARVDAMVTDLLDASRIRAGESLPIRFERMALNPLVDETVAELATLHGDRFVVRAGSAIEGCWSPRSIRRALENLCSNAVKYGDSRTPITVELSESGERVAISVHNFGPAIREDEMRSIFESFRRTDRSESGGRQGWGLGLMLVKGIAEAHDGSVRVESDEQMGTTFTMELARNPGPC